MVSKLTEFYNGKTIFLTGASGYVGMIFLDIMLRCFPNIKRIYALIRPKKGLKPEERKEEIFKSRLLISLWKENPELVDKVQVVTGDLLEENFGISDEDMKRICDEVTIVIHFGASVLFDNSYRTAAKINAKGTYDMIQFCRRIKNLEAFIYTSTAFSNTHKHWEKIEEKVYELPVPTDRFMDELENGTDESFHELVFSTGYKWANSYAFSKCLAENVVVKYASDLPTVIIRPSCIIQNWKGANAGYLVSGLAFHNATYGVARGIIRVLPARYYNHLDVIPADVVINAHIIAVWGIATGRLPRLFVINNIGGDTSVKMTFGDHVNHIVEIARRNMPIPKGFQTPSAKVIENKLLYNLLHYYEEYVPCAVLDFSLRLSGKEPKYVKMVQRTYKILDRLSYFITTDMEFYNDNFHMLAELLDPDDREMIYTEIKDVTEKDLLESSVYNSALFDPKTDYVSPKKRQHIVTKRTMFITFIRRFSLLLFLYVIYLIFKLIL